LWPGGVIFQISGAKDIRNNVKKAPIHHLQVGSLKDRCFLTLLEGSWWPGRASFQISGVENVRNPVKKAPIHHLQVGSLEDRWFLTHSGGSLWPGGVTFQISGVKDVRNNVKKASIHYLQVGSLEDRWFLTHFWKVLGGLEVPHFKFQVLRMSGTLSKRPLSTIFRLGPWRTGGS